MAFVCKPQVPFGLVATAYRRKRMLEGIMTADKEVRAQLAQMSEKQANDAIMAQTILGGAHSLEGESPSTTFDQYRI